MKQKSKSLPAMAAMGLRVFAVKNSARSAALTVAMAA
jgi:hypothetical protein